MSAKAKKPEPLDKLVTIRSLGIALTAMEIGFRKDMALLEERLTPWYTKVWRRIWQARPREAGGSKS